MNKLDQLLHDWSERSEPDASRLLELQHALCAKLASQASEVTVVAATPKRAPIRRPRQSRQGFAIAVTMVTAVMAAWWIASMAPSVDQVTDSSATTPSAPAPDQQRSLLAELDRMFEGQWRWWGEVNGNVQLQTSDAKSASREPGVIVRLTVVRRRPGERDWSVVWDAQVMSHEGEWVQLPKELTGDSTVSIWSHTLPDGATFVESDVALVGPVSMHAAEPRVFDRSSQSARLWSARRADGEFELIESFARLEANHG